MNCPHGLRPWRCLTAPARVSIWLIVTIILLLEIKVVGIDLLTALCIASGALFVSVPLGAWVQRGLLPAAGA